MHDANALLLHTAGSVEEAERAGEAGADVIVAQGWEAGGHVRGEVTTMALYAGQSVGLVQEVASASEIVIGIAAQAARTVTP